jgi:hypoxanthine phosphoribosyltransferase
MNDGREVEKYQYYYDEFTRDIRHWYKHFKRQANLQIVGIYRGSLPIATHLSNILECPMSIIKFQSRDGEDEKPEWLINNIPKSTASNIIVVDDIYDTGYTFRMIQEMEEFKNNPSVTYAALFGSKNPDGVSYLNERINRWIVFPWERVIGGM